MKPFVKIALFTVLFFVLAAVLVGLYFYNEKHPDLTKARADFKITATELQKEFEENESTASSKYINKILEVSGEVASINPSENKIMNISLKTGNDMSSVICTLAASVDASKVNARAKIVIRGECSGFLMDVLMNNCVIVTD